MSTPPEQRERTYMNVTIELTDEEAAGTTPERIVQFLRYSPGSPIKPQYDPKHIRGFVGSVREDPNNC